MKIKKVEFKNFASYGNRTQVIEFEKEKSDLYLVLGGNGAGKSTLAKVITYLCYGKVEGAHLRDLPNRVNKALWGKIWLESKGNRVEIERGISPGIFNVKLNGAEYDVAGKVNLQDFLETEIYEIPYHVFKNVIILSVNDFKSFITMSPYDKKRIIDKIFGFSIINEMAEAVKEKRRSIIEDIKTFEDEIRTLNESIDSVYDKIEQIEILTAEKDKSKVKKLKQDLVGLNKKRKTLQDITAALKTKLESTELDSRNRSTEHSVLKHKISNVKQELKLFENSTCPTCTAPLTSDFHLDIKKEKEESLVTLEEEFEIAKNKYEDSVTKLQDLRVKGREIHVRKGQLEVEMENLKNKLIELAEKDESDSSTNLKQLVKDFKSRKKVKTDGIKNLAVRSILPSFNNHILLMGREMGIPFAIKFDDKFNCTLHHLGTEISPKTLSTGEKKKVDFVIIMALMKMIKVRFPSLNILFLDEIFSSIDSDGVYHIINILHDTIQDIGLNTFVINHTVLPSEYFDKKLEITKDAGFSEFIIETIG